MKLHERLGHSLGRLVLSGLLIAPAAQAEVKSRVEHLRAERLAPPLDGLKPLAVPLRRPGPGDWLASHRENGQSMSEFLRSGPTRPAPGRRTIDVLPIGDFNRSQQRIIDSAVDYLGRFYGLPIRKLAGVPRSGIPSSAVRHRRDLGWSQVSSRYVIDSLLPSRRGSATFAAIALSSDDLYPDPSWNFVFGQASPSSRCGVWSMYRFGDPEKSNEAYRICLLRTLKTASHEVGHMMALNHCIAHECLMNGSNHLGELDGRPTEDCPICLSKLIWFTGIDPVRRARSLDEFFTTQRLLAPRVANRRLLEVLEKSAR